MKFSDKMKFTKFLTLFLICLVNNSFSQETLPIYQDYLSDNVYLVHPAAAGVGECSKIRLTVRAQWLNIDNAPQLQTISYHSRIKEDAKAAFGVIVFNDKNGYHSQKAIQGTYAYHLDLDQQTRINQLSFGLSLSAVFNEVDQRNFINDPALKQSINSNFYANADLGIGYHLAGFSSYLTIKNIFLTAKNSNTSKFDEFNLRNYIVGAGYFFGDKEKLQFEPSVLLQYKEQTSDKVVDLNFKVYKSFYQTQVWAALSYRQSFSDIFENGQYISPIIGVNLNKFMFSYTYTSQINEVTLTNGGFHQISLGYNLKCRKRRLSACPNINAQMF